MPSTRKAASKMAKSKQPRLRPVESILEEMNEMRDALMRRAYEIFDDRGRQGGRDLENWLDAKRELVWSPAIELTEKDGKIVLEAAVAGLEPDDLDVQITPEEVLIRSDHIHSEPVKGEKVYTCEFCSGKLFRDVRLPERVDPEHAEAEYRNGLLRITVPIKKGSRPRRIQIAD
jgi:HSP20 family protein